MIGRLVVLATACVALVACDAGSAPSAGSGPPRTTASAARPGIGVVDPRPGWTAAGVDGTPPPPGTCHARSGADGSPLPDPVCTPGATDPTTPSTLTLDVLYGLAAIDRNPPPAVRSAATAVVFAAYGIPADRRSSYVLDTLIPLPLGGSWAYRNLWPAPVPRQLAPNRSMRDRKDVTATFLRDAVVRHLATLPAVQRALTADWTTAVAALRLPPIPQSYARGG